MSAKSEDEGEQQEAEAEVEVRLKLIRWWVVCRRKRGARFFYFLAILFHNEKRSTLGGEAPNHQKRLVSKLKKTFTEFVKNGDIPNIILAGGAGTGKTTIARALCNELSLDCLLVNASEESGIDTLRNKIKQFASSMSLDMTQKYKVVILDEADYLNAQSTQPALRGFIEEFSANCRFILTCNFKGDHWCLSRCTVIDFNETNIKDQKIAATFMKRLQFILKEEEIAFDNQAIANLIMKHSPDWRRIINECQRYSTSGTLSPEIVTTGANEIKELIKFLKDKDFRSMRSWRLKATLVLCIMNL